MNEIDKLYEIAMANFDQIYGAIVDHVTDIGVKEFGDKYTQAMNILLAAENNLGAMMLASGFARITESIVLKKREEEL